MIYGGLSYFMRRLRNAHIPPAVSQVQVIIVSHSEISRLLDAHVPPSVNRDAVKIASRLKNVTDYDAQIPPALSQVRCPGHHRE